MCMEGSRRTAARLTFATKETNVSMRNRRNVIVMGATSGIGYEVAKILASRGWRVGVAGRREDILAQMVA